MTLCSSIFAYYETSCLLDYQDLAGYHDTNPRDELEGARLFVIERKGEMGQGLDGEGAESIWIILH